MSISVNEFLFECKNHFQENLLHQTWQLVGFVYKVIKIIYILDPVMKITVKVVKYAFCMVKECAWVLNMQMLDSPH